MDIAKQIEILKLERQKLNPHDAQQKARKKVVTRQIQTLKSDMEARHAKELAGFAEEEKNAPPKEESMVEDA